MVGILERIATKLSGRKRTVEAEYYALCRQIAEGHEPDADTLAAAMNDAGKGLEDVRAFVETYAKRKAIHERLDEVPALRKEQERLTATCDAADKALDAAAKKHAEVVAVPVVRLQQVAEYVRGCEGLDRELVASCPYPAMQTRHAELSAQIAALEAEKFGLVTKPQTGIVGVVAISQNGPAVFGKLADPSDGRRIEREAAEAKSRLSKIDAELVTAKAELADLESAMKQL
jgi:hypothetical protein